MADDLKNEDHINNDDDARVYAYPKKSPNCDTQPLKGRDLTHKCSLSGDAKRSFSRVVGQSLLKDWG